MSAKPVIRRLQAIADVDLAIDHYGETGGARVVLGFIAALEAAYARVGISPGAGSPRWAH